jgi:hypothetical protein
VIYADHAATTQLDPKAFEAMKPWLLEEYGNPSQLYAFSRKPKKALAEARAVIASCIHAQPEEIFFTSGGTESDNWAIKGSAFADAQKRATITSAFEHHAILHACSAIERLGWPVAYLPPTVQGFVEPEALEQVITDRTRLVSIMLVNNEMVKYDLIDKTSNLTLCPVDKQKALNELRAADVNVKDAFQESKDKYIKDKWSSMKSMLVMAGIILAISFIEIYLMIRASFISRIREVGVYRAIGVKKFDIYKMFSGEIMAITTMAGLPGFLFMAFVLSKLSKVTYFSDIFLINPPVIFVCLVLVYGLNLLFGLLPVWKTIRKTPAEILSRNDIG